MRKTALLSVIVCTHDRVAELTRCLGALAALEDAVEVIVVDSASTPAAASQPGVVAAVDRLLSGSIVRVEEPGLSRARNVGTAAATCEIVAFIDDDAFVRPDWARRIAAGFSNGDVACVGGSCEPIFESSRPSWLSDRLLQFAGATRLGTVPRAVTGSRDYPFGANVAFRRDDLLAMGGFDEALGRMGSSLLSGEESAVMDRLIATGKTVWLQPDAAVDHLIQERRTESSWYWSRMWWAGVGRARVQSGTGTFLRISAAAPVRAVAWAGTRDRVYLYRLAETAGYIAERVRGLRGSLTVGRR